MENTSQLTENGSHKLINYNKQVGLGHCPEQTNKQTNKYLPSNIL